MRAMRTSGYGWLLATATALATPAWAESRSGDLPPYSWDQSWTGFYLGAAFGGTAAVQNTNTSLNGVSLSNQGVGGQGVLASIYGGYDLQVLPKALVGVLVEGTW